MHSKCSSKMVSPWTTIKRFVFLMDWFMYYTNEYYAPEYMLEKKRPVEKHWNDQFKALCNFIVL